MRAIIEAQLVYRPEGIGGENVIALGTTSDGRVLRVVRDTLLSSAREEATMWQGVEPGIEALRHAEYERLAQVLSVLLPDDDLRPDLHPVPPSRDRGPRQP